MDIEQNKIHISPDAVDLDIFDIQLDKKTARQKFKLSQAQIILGYTGSFMTKEMDKGLTDIFKALKILNRKNIIFVALGGLPRHIDYYSKLAADLKVENQIMLSPKVEQSKLAIFQQACDILLMPFPRTEHYSYFMSPLKMFEYLASQRPIVATDLPTIKEVLNDHNAILVKPDNPPSLAHGIKRLLNNKDLADKITKSAYQDVAKYTWQKRVENILKFLNAS